MVIKMRVVIQRVKRASVKVDNKIVGKCEYGYLLLVGFTHNDNELVVNKMVDKVLQLRINEDDQGKTNLNLAAKNGQILSVSQFTLYANCKEGRRPSFVDAMNPNEASRLYDLFNAKLKEKCSHVETGVFGGDMKVHLINDGPFTIVLDSEELKFKR
jgi:D-tyrosyl-tRNA(Tyr) deacylase